MRILIINKFLYKIQKKKKYEEYEIDEFLKLIAKKKIQLQWIDYFLSHCEIYLEFVDENDWEQYIRFDLCLKTIEYDWIDKRINNATYPIS